VWFTKKKPYVRYTCSNRKCCAFDGPKFYDNPQFCAQCGKQLVVIKPFCECGGEDGIGPSDIFCSGCGKKLEDSDFFLPANPDAMIPIMYERHERQEAKEMNKLYAAKRG